MFRGRSSCTVVQRSGSLIEAPRVPRIRESELLEIEVVAEFVAERAQECSERGDLLPQGTVRIHTRISMASGL